MKRPNAVVQAIAMSFLTLPTVKFVHAQPLPVTLAAVPYYSDQKTNKVSAGEGYITVRFWQANFPLKTNNSPCGWASGYFLATKARRRSPSP